MTIPHVLERAAGTWGDDEALVDGEVRLTFAELRDQAHRAARAVVAAGVAKGDRVAIWAPNIHEWVVAALGALCAGAALVPLNTRFKGPEAAYVLNRSGAPPETKKRRRPPTPSRHFLKTSLDATSC